MADPGKVKLSDTHLKQLLATLKESAYKYDEVRDHIKNYQAEQDKSTKSEIEDVLNRELKTTLDMCIKVQKEIEVIEHKAKQATKAAPPSADGSKKNASAFAADFRLTPEEQDIAYEFKAHVMRKIHAQNQNIKKELELHEKKADLKKCQQTFKKQVEDQTKSQSTLVHLTNQYEKRTLAAETTVKRLEAQLREADQLIFRYEDIYRKDGGDVRKMREPQSKSAKNVRPADIIRKNEVVMEENQKHKAEIQRLKADNADLIKKVKYAEADRDEAMHRLGTVDMQRIELQKRLEKEQKEHKALKASFNNQASNWLLDKKSQRLEDEGSRQDQVIPMSPLGAKERLYQYPVKKNTDLPRQTQTVK